MIILSYYQIIDNSSKSDLAPRPVRIWLSATSGLVPPSHSALLGEAIETFVSDSALGRRVGEAAQRHVLQNFTWEQAAHRGLDFYRRVLGSHANLSRVIDG
jgi:glycosyltransferase involved in cell wall biosynthesis